MHLTLFYQEACVCGLELREEAKWGEQIASSGNTQLGVVWVGLAQCG